VIVRRRVRAGVAAPNCSDASADTPIARQLETSEPESEIPRSPSACSPCFGCESADLLHIPTSSVDVNGVDHLTQTNVEAVHASPLKAGTRDADQSQPPPQARSPSDAARSSLRTAFSSSASSPGARVSASKAPRRRLARHTLPLPTSTRTDAERRSSEGSGAEWPRPTPSKSRSPSKIVEGGARSENLVDRTESVPESKSLEKPSTPSSCSVVASHRASETRREPFPLQTRSSSRYTSPATPVRVVDKSYKVPTETRTPPRPHAPTPPGGQRAPYKWMLPSQWLMSHTQDVLRNIPLPSPTQRAIPATLRNLDTTFSEAAQEEGHRVLEHDALAVVKRTRRQRRKGGCQPRAGKREAGSRIQKAAAIRENVISTDMSLDATNADGQEHWAVPMTNIAHQRDDHHAANPEGTRQQEERVVRVKRWRSTKSCHNIGRRDTRKQTSATNSVSRGFITKNLFPTPGTRLRKRPQEWWRASPQTSTGMVRNIEFPQTAATRADVAHASDTRSRSQCTARFVKLGVALSPRSKRSECDNNTGGMHANGMMKAAAETTGTATRASATVQKQPRLSAKTKPENPQSACAQRKQHDQDALGAIFSGSVRVPAARTTVTVHAPGNVAQRRCASWKRSKTTEHPVSHPQEECHEVVCGKYPKRQRRQPSEWWKSDI